MLLFVGGLLTIIINNVWVLEYHEKSRNYYQDVGSYFYCCACKMAVSNPLLCLASPHTLMLFMCKRLLEKIALASDKRYLNGVLLLISILQTVLCNYFLQCSANQIRVDLFRNNRLPSSQLLWCSVTNHFTDEYNFTVNHQNRTNNKIIWGIQFTKKHGAKNCIGGEEFGKAEESNFIGVDSHFKYLQFKFQQFKFQTTAP